MTCPSLTAASPVSPGPNSSLGTGGQPEPDRELRARILAIFLSAALAEYAARQNMPGLLGEARAGLRRAVAG